MHKQIANDISYTIDGDPIGAYSASPTHIQTQVPGVFLSIDGDKYRVNRVGEKAERYEGSINPTLPWL